MNKKIATILLGTVISAASMNAQKQTVYYTSNLQMASASNASYKLNLEPLSENRFKGVMLDALDQKRSEGEFIPVGKKFIEDGHFKFYHPNGTLYDKPVQRRLTHYF